MSKVNDDFTKFVNGILNEINDEELTTDLKKVAEELGCTFNEEARATWIERNLEKIEEIMNEDRFYFEDTGIEFVLDTGIIENEFGRNEIIVLDVIDDCGEIIGRYTTTQIFDDMEENIRSLIGSIYVEDINYRKSYINKFKTFTSRKLDSLAKAIDKNDIKKINKINTELIERHKIVKKYKDDIQLFKSFVSNLYYVIDQLNMEV